MEQPVITNSYKTSFVLQLLTCHLERTSVCAALQETPTVSSANWSGARIAVKKVLGRHFLKKSIRMSARSLVLRDQKRNGKSIYEFDRILP